MAIEAQWTDGGEGMVVNCSGTIVAGDFVEAFDSLFTDDALRALKFELWDFTGAVGLNMTQAEMRMLGAATLEFASRNDLGRSWRPWPPVCRLRSASAARCLSRLAQ